MTRSTSIPLVLGVALLSSGCGAGESARPDFSGTWVLDLSRSSLEIPVPDSSIFVIDHVEPILTAERTHFADGVANGVRTELTADSVLRTLRLGDLDVPTRVYWDGQTLVLDQTWLQGEVRVTNLVRYTLADDGETMIAEERMSAAGDAHHNLWTFRRR